MSSVFNLRSIGLPSSSIRAKRIACYVIGSLALIVAIVAYCELCSIAWGLPAPGLGVSGPWALQVSLGWILGGIALGLFGSRIADSELAMRRPRSTLAAAIIAIAVLALLCEILVRELRGNETDLFLFAYHRSMIMLAVSTVLVGIYVVERALRRGPNALAALPPTMTGEAAHSDAIEVMTGTGRTMVRANEIECLRAEGNYITVVHGSGRTYLMRQTMASTEELLDSQCFVRIHRSTIINRHMIKERRPKGVLVMHSGLTVHISRAFRDRLR